MIILSNSPGTGDGPGGRDRTLAKKSRKNAQKSYQHISSSYAKVLGETNFPPREFPRSGSKAKDGKAKRKKKDRKLVLTMASYALQRHLGWRTQAAWANSLAC